MARSVEDHDKMMLTISPSIRWWVYPFMFGAWVIGAMAIAFIDVDRYAERVGRFIGNHGIRFKTS